MKNLKFALRSLFQRGNHTVVKIFTLGIGLAVGLVLLAKVFFEFSYDNFYPDMVNIRQAMLIYTDDGSGAQTSEQLMGGIAPLLVREIPGVEVATRYRPLLERLQFQDQAKQRLSGKVIFADEYFYDILPRPMVVGNAKEAFSKPMTAIVSISTAKAIGGDVVGKTIEFDNYPGRPVTIAGVFEDIPLNSDNRYDIAISMQSLGRFTYDTSESLSGGSAYRTFIKMARGVTDTEIGDAVNRLYQRYLEMNDLDRDLYTETYYFIPAIDFHATDPATRNAIRTMTVLALAVLAAAVINYILIVISSFSRRFKEVAIYKCYGAGRNNIISITMIETLVHLLMSLLLAAVLIGLYRNTVTQLIGTPPAALFSWRGIAMIGGVCILILLVASYLPSKILSKIPVATVFRSYRNSHRRWKRILMFIEMAAAVFFAILTAAIWKQHIAMLNFSPGYETENTAFFVLAGVPEENKRTVLEAVSAMSEVESVGTSVRLPFGGSSGNAIFADDSYDKFLFYYADMAQADENFMPTMGIDIVDGEPLREGITGMQDVVVSREFADKLSDLQGWTDGAVGKTFTSSEHGELRMTGIHETFTQGTGNDRRPTLFFLANFTPDCISVRFDLFTGENLLKLQKTVEGILPDKKIDIYPYQTTISGMFEQQRSMAKSVLIGCLVTLLIVVAGVIGYINTETSRRGVEIALRRVNGATVKEIIAIFARHILRIGLLATVVVTVPACLAAIFLMGMPLRDMLWPPYFLACIAGLLAIITITAILGVRRIATRNPTETLQSK